MCIRDRPYTLSESRVVFEDWRSYYNDERPHRSLGLQTPAKFAERQSFEGSDSGRPTASLRQSLQEKRKKTDKPKPPETVSQGMGQNVGLDQERRSYYNQLRPHSSLGGQSPAKFASHGLAPVGAPPLPSPNHKQQEPKQNLS